MNKVFKRLIFFGFSLVLLVNLSGCAKVSNPKTGQVYPINNVYFWDHYFIRPIAWLVNLITQHTGSFALGILIATIVVRTILFPIYTKSNDMSTKMQAIQPDVKKLQDKYNGKTDPESRSKMQMEMMKLYKDNNVSMFGGCLMPLLQMPVFIAMYDTVVKTPISYGFTAAQLRFLWLPDGLSAKDPYYIMPILVALTAVLLQYISTLGLSAEAKNNPTMKMMMWMMPGMMLIFSVTQASALSLYWIVGNIYSTLQIIVVKRPFKIHFKPFKIELKNK